LTFNLHIFSEKSIEIHVASGAKNMSMPFWTSWTNVEIW